jgi:hypothetical protein
MGAATPLPGPRGSCSGRGRGCTLTVQPHRPRRRPLWWLRARQLARELYCRACAEDGRRRRAVIADHVLSPSAQSCGSIPKTSDRWARAMPQRQVQPIRWWLRSAARASRVIGTSPPVPAMTGGVYKKIIRSPQDRVGHDIFRASKFCRFLTVSYCVAMRRGTKPKPTEIKKMAGTLRPCRLPSGQEPVAPGAILGPPGHFSARQREIWQQTLADAPRNLWRAADAGMLAGYVLGLPACNPILLPCRPNLPRERFSPLTQSGHCALKRTPSSHRIANSI